MVVEIIKPLITTLNIVGPTIKDMVSLLIKKDKNGNVISVKNTWNKHPLQQNNDKNEKNK